MSTDNKQSWAANDVVKMQVADLVPYARNCRTHSEEQVAQIAASITEWGWTSPILVDEANGIIAGHGRILAAYKLNIVEVPCMVAKGWSVAQKQAYIIADNKLALNAGWDMDLLSVELDGLADVDFNLDLTGFADFEIEEITGIIDDIDLPTLNDGDKDPFQQITFTLHDDQADQVKSAMEIAKNLGDFEDSPNPNSNGNYLAFVCETFITQNGGEG